MLGASTENTVIHMVHAACAGFMEGNQPYLLTLLQFRGEHRLAYLDRVVKLEISDSYRESSPEVFF